jgi:hypothetical protein
MTIIEAEQRLARLKEMEESVRRNRTLSLEGKQEQMRRINEMCKETREAYLACTRLD